MVCVRVVDTVTVLVLVVEVHGEGEFRGDQVRGGDEL